MGQLVNDTLSAWLLIESLNPGEVSYNTDDLLSQKHFKNNIQQVQLHSFDEYYDIWNDERFIISDEMNKQGDRVYRFYRNCFRYNQINLKIQDVFNNHSEIFNPNMTHCYGYTFDTDKNGNVILDSIHVPMIMSALKEIEQNRSADIETKFNDSLEKFLQKVKEILANQPINAQKLEKMDRVYDKYFSVLKANEDRLFQHYVAIEFVEKKKEPKPEFNSFFISDIEMARKSPNQILVKYVEGLEDQQRIVIDENKEQIEKFLHPSNLPDGRWPSQTEFRLSLMQQVAVNQITSNEDLISSVNGPPGTGKTTLLKDIFAHFVVERAKALAQLDNPKHAFEPTKIHKTDEKSVYLLKNDIAKYKMVVASSNNGAVENISKDLPKIEEIIRNPNDCAFPDYERDYAKLVRELESFTSIAEDLIGESAWGLFSGVFGKSKNISEVMEHLLKTDDKSVGLSKMLKNEFENIGYNELMKQWKKQKKAFLDELEEVKTLKEKSIEAFSVYKKFKKSLSEEKILKEKEKKSNSQLVILENDIDKIQENINQFDIQMNDKDKKLEIINEYLETTQQKGIINKLKSIFSSETDEQSQQHIDDKKRLLDEKLEIEQAKQDMQSKLSYKIKKKDKLSKQIIELQDQLKKNNEVVQQFNQYRMHSDIAIPSKNFWTNKNYDERQVSNLWTSDALQYHRAMVFLRAMILHKLLLIANYKTVYFSLIDFKNRRKLIDSKPEVVYNAWNVMHLIFPVVSTTFASFKSMYQGIPKDFIDYLFIDEAGQAVPQAAVGALYRSKKVVAVGDPLQIEPVVTLESHLIDNIRKSYNISERLLSKEVSVQSVADNANRYGFWKGDSMDDEQTSWIGIPLWVHRRCLNPMFTIANQIAYDNKMVLPSNIKKEGKVGWYHVVGKASSKQYVKAHGEKIIELLVNDWREALNKGENEPSSFVISPFSTVQMRIKSLVKQKLPKMLDMDKRMINKWADKSIGTVHTFQGKEAQKVYFVVGTDKTQEGALNWSCEKPNLLNVAVTRAKKEFYVIGDMQRIHSKPFYEIIYKELNTFE